MIPGNNFNTPVLLIVFNRLNTTKEVFSAIKTVKPLKFFIAADGPRPDRTCEAEKCNEIRKWILENIDWDCEVKTLFQEKNLGCGLGPAAAISWFFNNVEEGIILEDDCVPDVTFFEYCSELLNKYRNDKRISIISGTNIDKQQIYTPLYESYFFSVIPLTWGWATWKRNWDKFDFQIKKWETINRKRFLKYIFKDKRYYRVWELWYNQIYKDPPVDIWDYQFFFSSFINKQLAIIPKVNLISNIGHDSDATHTTTADDIMGNIKRKSIKFPLVHPVKIIRNLSYDIYLQSSNYGEYDYIPIRKKISRWMKRKFSVNKEIF